MARMHPPQLPQGTVDSEVRVWHALTALDDDWSVFHSVAWQGERGDKHGEGEGDFILVHPRRGVLFLEVKGGSEFRIVDGEWFRFRAGQLVPIPDPFEQARSTEHEVMDRIVADLGLRGVGFGHGVVFPHLLKADGLGIDADPAMVLTRKDLASITESVDALADHWGIGASLSESDVAKIGQLLKPTVVIRKVLDDDLFLIRQKIDKWTEDQVEVLDGLRNNRRTLIYGGAGTGKTILAMEKARRLAAAGKSSLVVAFNVPVSIWIKAEMKDEPLARVGNFHGLVREAASEARKLQTEASDRLRFSHPEKPDDAWYEGPDAEMLVDAAAVTGLSVDAVIIDEGQDFARHHFDALEALLTDPKTGEFHIFLDPNQSLFQSDWTPPFEGFSFSLQRNCRNTSQIAELVSRVMAGAGEPARVDGLDIKFIPIENSEGAEKALRGLVDEISNKGKVAFEKIAILASERDLVDRLVGTKVAGIPLVRPPRTEGIRVDTIHRFKGLEADAVIVIITDEARGDNGSLDDRQQKLAYVGLSRPNAFLCVVATRSFGAAIGLS